MTDHDILTALEEARTILVKAQIELACGPRFALFIVIDAGRYIEGQMKDLFHNDE